MEHIYMDYNASTPIAPEVKDTIIDMLDNKYGNPSASHWAGTPAKDAVEHARTQVASLIGASPEEIIFTSGGTEANNHVLKGVTEACEKKAHVITTTIEHPAIHEPCRYLEKHGAEVTYVGTDTYGQVDPAEIEAAIKENTALISVMHANNETGTINHIDQIAKIAQRHKIALHSDAAQSLGKIPVHVQQLGVDYLSIAGHKLYAPKGVGALYIRKGKQLPSFMHGAGHEQGRRAGTENVVLTAALGTACELAEKELYPSAVQQLRDDFWQQLQDAFGDQVVLNGHPTERLPNTLHVSFKGTTGQDILDHMPEIAASTGAACHSGSVNLSAVLKAMGTDPEIGKGAIRFSLGRYSTHSDIHTVVEKLKAAFSR
ncbi:cysteine desulfurase [Salibacterium salarium]|uniref:cysteine desulfurase n=1 Tax=Salibacterium salarium TaxID=284579 RepID=A0A428MXC4_9BACI|nr:cysteine desulfurase family protein [Salibacterium salarium]RSL30782.1 cysteine desulfurase [Salibacterium salarium]